MLDGGAVCMAVDAVAQRQGSKELDYVDIDEACRQDSDDRK